MTRSSAIAQKRSPVRRAGTIARDVATAVVKPFRRDLFATFLLVATVLLTILFFILLGSLRPGSSGREVPLTQITALAENGAVETATLLDQDSRVEVTTRNAELDLWASYPSSDAQTQALFRELSANGAQVTVNQQSRKPTRSIVIQFLLPIVILVCLFALFTRIGGDPGSGGIAAFSNIGNRKRKRAKGANEVTLD